MTHANYINRQEAEARVSHHFLTLDFSKSVVVDLAPHEQFVPV